MPNKMFYGFDDDLALLARAQDLSGTSLSSTVALVLRQHVQQATEAGSDIRVSAELFRLTQEALMMPAVQELDI